MRSSSLGPSAAAAAEGVRQWDVSVVIPAYRAQRTLPRVLDALPAATSGLPCRVVVVDSTDADGSSRLAGWPVKVVVPSQRTWPGEARNLGVASVSTEWIAFLDADAIPDPGWLPALLAAAAPEVDAVVGAVRNATPRSAVGTAGWFLEFSEFRTDRHQPPRHGATCNLLIRRQTLIDMGGFPTDTWPGEDTIVTFKLSSAGRLAFAADATVAHLNRTGFREFLRHQRRLGASFRQVCQAVPFPHGWITRRPVSVAAGGLRVLALAMRVRRNRHDVWRALTISPILAAGLGAWTVGLVSGP